MDHLYHDDDGHGHHAWNQSEYDYEDEGERK